jgi:hypothetical protein
MVMVALEYKIGLSRLKVVELDNSSRINDTINMVLSEERFELL